MQWIRRFVVAGRGGREVSVNAHAVPVVGSDAIIHGLTLLLHDVSPEISLEQRCRSLHELATKDPLTQVANRAEFDRVHELFVAAHRESNRPCALIMADIDRFKKINDTYGHQAGDAVIQSFARLLQNACHPGDLVARYGGEEFVMLCADCDNTTAARRAEETRLQLSEFRQAALDGNSASASFGVTEIQPGDTTETMLRRADRALMMSKQTGRNRVTQLGSGGDGAKAICRMPPNARDRGLRGPGPDHSGPGNRLAGRTDHREAARIHCRSSRRDLVDRRAARADQARRRRLVLPPPGRTADSPADGPAVRRGTIFEHE